MSEEENPGGGIYTFIKDIETEMLLNFGKVTALQ